MSLKPLDMQVMIPKTQEVAQLNHLRQQQGHLNQNQINHNLSKLVTRDLKNVNKPNEKEQTYSKFDAKEKGNNSYSNQSNKKNKKQKQKQTIQTMSSSKIDIRI